MSTPYDPRDPATIDDPLPVLTRLQDEDPVHWSPILRGWVITRYDDVRRVQLDRGISADRMRPFYASLPGEEQQRITQIIRYLDTWVAFKDPPDHGRMRRLMNAVFTVREIDALRPMIEAAVEERMAAIERLDEFDFIAEFAGPLPATVIMHMLGLPPGDMERLREWSSKMQLFIGSATTSEAKYDLAEEGAKAMAGYFREVIRHRERRPGNDMISKLLALRENQQGLTEDEVVGSCMLFLFGGHETTTNLIGNGTRLLMRHPAARERLRTDPGAVDSAVEEVLRHDGPTGALVRVVKETHAMHGRTLAAGDRVFIMIHAANHDPRRFVRPGEFDIDRQPNPHLTFNYGPHFCLGAPLARLEGRIALAEVARRLPRLRLAVDRVAYMDTLVMRGVRAMPVRQD
jgi:cytochrome P450